jgi:hypothetical protein
MNGDAQGRGVMVAVMLTANAAQDTDYCFPNLVSVGDFRDKNRRMVGLKIRLDPFLLFIQGKLKLSGPKEDFGGWIVRNGRDVSDELLGVFGARFSYGDRQKEIPP